MFIPLISGGPLSGQRCLSQVRHCLHLLVKVVDWSVSPLVKSDNFDSKQSREAVDLPLTCHPSPNLAPFPFSSSVRGQASLARV